MNIYQAIREAAEIVGWKSFDSAPNIFQFKRRGKSYREMWPIEYRTDLHTLVGLLEDWCRERAPFPKYHDGMSMKNHDGVYICFVAGHKGENKDWLHAKLFALLSLARTLR